jgi:hypothetical protein
MQLTLGVLSAQLMLPTQQPLIRRRQRCATRDRSRNDETIGGIAVYGLEFSGKDGDFAAEREFGNASARPAPGRQSRTFT